jgi:hypothetical protein
MCLEWQTKQGRVWTPLSLLWRPFHSLGNIIYINLYTLFAAILYYTIIHYERNNMIRIIIDDNDILQEVSHQLILKNNPDLYLANKLTETIYNSTEMSQLGDQIEEYAIQKLREMINEKLTKLMKV